MVVAKGRGATALAIRELAGELDVPILEYPQLARAVYYTSKENQVIWRRSLHGGGDGARLRLPGQQARAGSVQPAITVPETALFDEKRPKTGARALKPRRRRPFTRKSRGTRWPSNRSQRRWAPDRDRHHRAGPVACRQQLRQQEPCALPTRAIRSPSRSPTVGTIKSNISDFASALASLTSVGLARHPADQLEHRHPQHHAPVGCRSRGPQRDDGSAPARPGPGLELAVLRRRQRLGGGAGKLTLTFGTATVADGAMTGFTAGAATPIDITIDLAQSRNACRCRRGDRRQEGGRHRDDPERCERRARLVLKSGTGSSQAFTLSGTDGRAQLAVGPGVDGSTINAAAQDARSRARRRRGEIPAIRN